MGHGNGVYVCFITAERILFKIFHSMFSGVNLYIIAFRLIMSWTKELYLAAIRSSGFKRNFLRQSWSH